MGHGRLTGFSQHTLARLSLLASLVGAIVGELAGWYGDTLWLEIAVDPLNRIAARVVGVDLRHLSLAPLK